jgi:hypothetical protein
LYSANDDSSFHSCQTCFLVRGAQAEEVKGLKPGQYGKYGREYEMVQTGRHHPDSFFRNDDLSKYPLVRNSGELICTGKEFNLTMFV